MFAIALGFVKHDLQWEPCNRAEELLLHKISQRHMVRHKQDQM